MVSVVKNLHALIQPDWATLFPHFMKTWNSPNNSHRFIMLSWLYKTTTLSSRKFIVTCLKRSEFMGVDIELMKTTRLWGILHYHIPVVQIILYKEIFLQSVYFWLKSLSLFYICIHFFKGHTFTYQSCTNRMFTNWDWKNLGIIHGCCIYWGF